MIVYELKYKSFSFWSAGVWRPISHLTVFFATITITDCKRKTFSLSSLLLLLLFALKTDIDRPLREYRTLFLGIDTGWILQKCCFGYKAVSKQQLFLFHHSVEPYTACPVSMAMSRRAA